MQLARVDVQKQGAEAVVCDLRNGDDALNGLGHARLEHGPEWSAARYQNVLVRVDDLAALFGKVEVHVGKFLVVQQLSEVVVQRRQVSWLFCDCRNSSEQIRQQFMQ